MDICEAFQKVSIRRSIITKKVELLFNKVVKQVGKNFKNLPKSLNWRAFYLNDLQVLMDICEGVQ
jgi:putative transposon-encoded protein